MSNAETTNLAETDPERFARVELKADIHIQHLRMDGAHEATEVLMCTVTKFFLGIRTVPGVTRLEAFDLYMAATRKTLEGNMEDGS